MLDYTGQVVLVAGGGSGIGAATAAVLGEQGATVVVADINTAGAAAVTDKIRADGHTAEAVTLDITDLEACQAAVAGITERHGSLEAMVLCPGWSETHRFSSEGPEYWQRVIDVNYVGTINACFAALPVMKEAGYGRIVAFSSDAARVGTWGEAVYAGAKAGVIGLIKSLAREYGKSGVTANVVSPGVTDTPLMRHQDQVVIDKMVQLVTLKRIGEPAEVAAAAVFLASRQASFITGQVLSVSGGLTMVD
ncbi:glucose 1-dehydrogenase [Pseudonocardia ailaonensis]|uniref:Glucose 1-dehydrogenase n=1 Tax=Pseudonocardia ailaonensis TaxID=367279 RepID=A0ABN2NIB0_9PSEU